MSDKVIVVMDKPKDCQNCVWGVCKYSTPLSTRVKGYCCGLQEIEDGIVDCFDYDSEVHLENCPLVSKESYDKEIRDKAIKEFAKRLIDKTQTKLIKEDIHSTTRSIGMDVCGWIQEIAEQMKEVEE